MKIILVPIDFSKASEKALIYAADLAKRLDGKIILFHSFHSYHTNAYASAKTMDHDVELAKRKSNKIMKTIWASVSEHFPVVPEMISSEHSMHDEIPGLIKEKKVDLVVMGTLGMGNRFEGLIFGTNTSWMVEKASCPVIAIPESSERLVMDEIVYASDYLNTDLDNLKSVAMLARLFDSKLTIVHVARENNAKAETDKESFREKLTAMAGLPELNIKILKGNNVENTLEKYLSSEKVDLLVMSAQQRDLMDKLFGKSITRVMTLYLKVPLMVFHHK